MKWGDKSGPGRGWTSQFGGGRIFRTSRLVEYFGYCGPMRQFTDLGLADSGSPWTDASGDSRTVHFGPLPICLENTPLLGLAPDPPCPCPPSQIKQKQKRCLQGGLNLGPTRFGNGVGVGGFKGNHTPPWCFFILFYYFILNFSKGRAQPHKGNGAKETALGAPTGFGKGG